MIVCVLVLALSCAIFGPNHWLTPLSEWVTTILYLNYFCLLSFTNNFFDSVHPFDTDLEGKSQE
jgi:hypothetical protein